MSTCGFDNDDIRIAFRDGRKIGRRALIEEFVALVESDDWHEWKDDEERPSQVSHFDEVASTKSLVELVRGFSGGEI